MIQSQQRGSATPTCWRKSATWLSIVFILSVSLSGAEARENADRHSWRYQRRKQDSPRKQGKTTIISQTNTQKSKLMASNLPLSDGTDDLFQEYLFEFEPAKKTRGPHFKYIKKRGRVDWNVGYRHVNESSTSAQPGKFIAGTPHNKNGTIAVGRRPLPPMNSNQDDIASVSVDPLAAFRILRLVFVATQSFTVSFIGTLRLLGPMIFARRVLYTAGESMSDYMMGRYLRKTYTRIEHGYFKKYEGPGALRSLGRSMSQMVILLYQGRFFQWLVDLSEKPCVIEGTGRCHWWCGMLWITAVVGSGNALAVAISHWGGPLRIKVKKSSYKPKENTHQSAPTQVFRGAWKLIVQGMRDPDKWISVVALNRRETLKKTGEPFNPIASSFPCTWSWLRILQAAGVARAMGYSSVPLLLNSMHVIMRLYLVQHTFADEWYRVLLLEKRVGLGLSVITISSILISLLFMCAALTDSLAALLILPSLLATFSSGWMNLYIYWDRKREMPKRQRKDRADSQDSTDDSYKDHRSGAAAYAQLKASTRRRQSLLDSNNFMNGDFDKMVHQIVPDLRETHYASLHKGSGHESNKRG